jgi:arabinofuranosyltransferase
MVVEPQNQPHGRSRMRPKYLLLAIIVAALTYLGRHTEIDDALIYARYIANALAGKGLVFNPGELINALTSPLFAYLLLGTSWLMHGQVLLATVLLSGILLFFAVVLAERLVPFAGFLVVCTSYFYTLLGMETALFLFLLVLTLTLYVERRDYWLPLASILLVLTRAEGGAMVLFIAIGLYRQGRLPKWTSYLPVAAVVVIYLLLNYHWYHSLIPSSATSKLGQGRSGIWGRWPTAFLQCSRQLKTDFLPMFYIMPLVAGGAAYSLWRYRSEPITRIILGFSGVALAFYVVFNIPGYRWYFAPFIFFAMLAACRVIPSTKIWQWASIGLFALVLATSFRILYRTVAAPDGAIAMGRWLDQNTAVDSRIEASETGKIGYYSHRYLIDSLGLTTPKNADHIAHRDLSSWLAEDHPDYIVMHDGDMPWERVVKQTTDYLPTGTHLDNLYLLKRKSLNR